MDDEIKGEEFELRIETSQNPLKPPHFVTLYDLITLDNASSYMSTKELKMVHETIGKILKTPE